MKENEQRAKRKMKMWYDKKARKDPLELGEEVMVLLLEDSIGVMQWHGPHTTLSSYICHFHS